jgi:branched-chain amino acid transport system substrate-binding protein
VLSRFLKFSRLFLRLNAILVLFLLAGCFNTNESLKLALAVPLTGSQAPMGQSIVNGAMLAVEEINQAGGINGHAVSLSIRDDQGDREQAKLIAQDLIKEQPIAVFVALDPEISQAIIPIYAQAKILTISPSNSLLIDEKTAAWSLQNLANPAQEAKRLVQFFVDAGYRRLAIIHEPGKYGQTLRNQTRRHLAFHGLKPVWEYQNNGEQSNSWQALLDSGSEGIIYCGNYPGAAQWVEMLANHKLQLLIAGPQELFNRDFVRQAGKSNVQNVITIYPRVDYPADFWDRYKSKFGDPSTRAILAYLSTIHLLKAHQTHQSKPSPNMLKSLTQTGPTAHLHAPHKALADDYLHIWRANQAGQFHEFKEIIPTRWRKTGIWLGEVGRKVSN